ncbi:hypothetical protein IID62_07025 [candidate division KSB1 bacterium]|nr:hypothetical protein [candidate division KSB1 bacterium]
MKKSSMMLLFLLVTAFFSNSLAQNWEFYPNGTYDSRITKPSEFLGYELGSRFTFHHQIVSYLKLLAEESDRIQYHEYGKTYELRELVYLVISAPENLDRVDEIRRDNLRLADPRTTSGTAAQNIINTNPTIAYLAYGVHGNESCSSEAALLTAYQLAAGTDQTTLGILRDVVTILDPIENPDGRDHYSFRYNAALDKNPNSSQIAVERSAGGGGRTNHYNFDLNRDWAFLTQIESQERVKLYKQWKPQVAVDFHEMGSGSTYFFFPAATPINANYPDQLMKWQRIYGEGNAASFDYYGWKYYTQQGFDLLYPSFADSWTSFNGATGMTYEQAGGGSAGVILKRGDNDYLTLKQRLWDHFTTGMATLKTSMTNKIDRLRDFHDFFVSAIDEGENGGTKAYIIPPPANPFTFNIMLKNLLMQDIEVKRAEESFKVRNVRGYFDSSSREKEFPAGTYVLDLAQPQKRLLKVLFEQDQVLTDTSFYDISTWSYPYATNIETYWTSSKVNARTAPVTEAVPLKGNVANAPAKYAYLLPFKGVETTLAYYELARNDVQGGIANRPFTIEGNSYPRGTAVFYTGSNDDNLHTLVRETANKFGVAFTGVNTGIAEKGIDLGSGRISKLVKPKIGVVGNMGTVRHMFDHRYNIDFININPSRLTRIDIKEVNVIIAARGLNSSLSGEDAINGFKDWIRAGGVFIGWRGATTYALSDDVKLADFKLAERPEKDEETKKQEEEEQMRLTVEERETYRKPLASPGYFVRASLDLTHPLAYGMKKEIAVLKFGRAAFDLAPGGGMVGVFDKNPKLSGYAHPDNVKQISDKGYLAHSRMGRGHVILFTDDPTWREFMSGLEPLFLNAVLLMPSH